MNSFLPGIERGYLRPKERNLQKQAKNFVLKVAIFPLTSKFDCDFILTCLKLYYTCSKCLKMGKFGLFGAICQSNCVRVRSISNGKKLVYLKSMRLYLHSTAILCILSRACNRQTDNAPDLLVCEATQQRNIGK